MRDTKEASVICFTRKLLTLTLNTYTYFGLHDASLILTKPLFSSIIVKILWQFLDKKILQWN